MMQLNSCIMIRLLVADRLESLFEARIGASQ